MWVMGGDETDDIVRKNDVWWSPGVSGILEPDAVGNIRFALQGLRPNPFRDNATIMFAPPRGKRASVRIYSSAGALVRVLAQDAIARGAEGLEWNGVDQTGAMVPPGQYFVRFDCEATTITRKLTKLD